MNLALWLIRTARQVPAAPALLCGSRVVADYAAFAGRAASIAAGLQQRFRVGTGDRVALVLPNSTTYLELMYAAWFAGAAVVPVNCKLHAQEVAWIVGNAEPRVVLTSAETANELAPLLRAQSTTLLVTDEELAALRNTDAMTQPVARGRDDLAWLFYTSGTTGRPKGVMITNGNMHAMAFCYFVDVDAVHGSDAVLYAAPMSHGAGLYNFMGVLRGARHVVPDSGRFDPAEVLAAGRSLRNICMFAAPTMVQRLSSRPSAKQATEMASARSSTAVLPCMLRTSRRRQR